MLLSNDAGPQPQPLPNPMSEATQAYVRMAVRSARNPSMEDVSELGEGPALF